MFKKLTAITLAALILVSTAVICASAATLEGSEVGAEVSDSVGAEMNNSDTGASNLIYFDYSGASNWKNIKAVYCHIWERGGDVFFGWKSKGQLCTQVGPTKFSYDLTKLNNSQYNTGGMKKNKDYCVIFVADNDIQLYDTTISLDCAGDTLKATNKLLENAVDSNKKGNVAVWSKNGAKYGAHLTISSIGNVLGEKLCPNEPGLEALGDWLFTYYKSQYVKDVPGTLKKAMPKFGLSLTAENCNALYSYIGTKKGATKNDLDVIKDIIEGIMPKTSGNDPKPTLPPEPQKYTKPAVSGGNGNVNTNANANANLSNTGADGQSEVIFVVLGTAMLLSAATLIFARKRREE